MLANDQSQHVPAWKRIGLKLKHAKDIDTTVINDALKNDTNQSESNGVDSNSSEATVSTAGKGSKKRKLPEEDSARDNVAKKSKSRHAS